MKRAVKFIFGFIGIIFLSLIILLSLFVISAYWETDSNNFSEKKHIERISDIIEKKYIKKHYYTGYEIYPLYNESDKMNYCLIEFQPSGNLYVKIYEKGSAMPIFYNTMYLACRLNTWERYRIIEDEIEFPQYPLSDWRLIDKEGQYNQKRLYEVDENGKLKCYQDSHFKAAGIKDEKRFLLETEEQKYIPAVKRGDKYINLISMKDIKMPIDSSKESIFDLYFSQVPCTLL